jgi:hypothetical protein
MGYYLLVNMDNSITIRHKKGLMGGKSCICASDRHLMVIHGNGQVGVELSCGSIPTVNRKQGKNRPQLAQVGDGSCLARGSRGVDKKMIFYYHRLLYWCRIENKKRSKLTHIGD